jgi:hypothetical protein
MSQQFSRRRFLLGTSGLIALPMFESLMSSRAMAQASRPSRVIFMKFPNGVFENSWMPTGTGTNFTLPDQLSGLSAFRSDLILPTGLNNQFASGALDGAGDHARSAGCFLTCVRINKSEQDIRAATSVDRVIAERLSLTASPRWLVLGAPGQGWGDSGYGAAYTSNISWISPTTPASRVTDTRAAFNLLFPEGSGGNATELEAAKRRRYRRSILDGAVAEATALATRLGSSDRQKLDEYLTSVREVERNIASDEMNSPAACSPGPDPGSTGSDFARFTRTMMDLIVIAATCDRTRIVSYLLDYEGSNRGGIGGVSQGHHTVSHHPDNPSVYPDQYRRISRWYADQLVYFLGRMKNTTDAMGRPLLDSSLIVFGSDIHDGNRHNHNNLPIVLAGRGNGSVTPGRVIATSGAPLANLWVSIASRMGANITSFGDSNGSIAL